MSDLTRLSTKGQLVLPKGVRERLGWQAGTELVVEDRGDCVVLRARTAAGSLAWREMLGAAGYRGPRRSIAEMERAIAEEAAQGR